MLRIVRPAALVAAATISVSLWATPAQAAVDPRPAAVGATWLSGELTGGLIHNEAFDSDDYGLSIAVALALAAVGGHASTVTQIGTAIAANVDNYGTGAGWGYPDERYAGATAKTLVMAQLVGADPTTFGGVDVLGRLEGLTGSTAPTVGRIADVSEFGDLANVFGQAFAAHGLAAAGSSRAAAATDFLLAQQCSEGYFRLLFSAPDATDQTCDGGKAGGQSAPNADATALAVILLEAQKSEPDVAAAISAAGSWLRSTQAADGSFGGGVGTEAANSNSTGLAGWALGASGRTGAATKAASWLRQYFAGDVAPCTTKLTPDTGAVAYNRDSFLQGRKDAITDAMRDQWRRATAQALPALSWAPGAAAAYAVTGPTGFVRAGSTQTLRVAGLAPAERGCLSGPGAKKVLPGTGATLSTKVTLPAGTSRRVFAVTSIDGKRQVTLRALGRLTVPFTLADRTLAKGSRQTIRVTGLAGGEPVTVRWRGEVVAQGTAGATGVFSRSFAVGRVSGSGEVRVTGRFADLRWNAKSFTVR